MRADFFCFLFKQQHSLGRRVSTSKTPPHAQWLMLLSAVVPLLLNCSVFGLCSCCYSVHYICDNLDGEERSGCLTLHVFQMSGNY